MSLSFPLNKESFTNRHCRKT